RERQLPEANSAELELSQKTARPATALAAAVIANGEFFLFRFFSNGRRSSHSISYSKSLLPERHSQLFEKLPCLVVSPCGGDDRYIHSANLVHLLVRDFR